jgi:hypothetical protein
MTRHRSETNEHAINALLAKRQELMEEIGSTRERLAVLSNDIEALDRVLETLGYSGDIKLTPRVPRVVLFYRNELRQFCLGQLREHGERTSRQIAESLIQIEGKDARDRRMMVDVTRRVSKALRMMLNDRKVQRSTEKVGGEYTWRPI